MLSPNKKALITGYIQRNIQRGYLDLADDQIDKHIDDFSDEECAELQNLLNAKIEELTPAETDAEPGESEDEPNA